MGGGSRRPPIDQTLDDEPHVMTSSTPPAATRSTRDLMCRSSGPTWFMGEMTPWSTWYSPGYSRLRSTIRQVREIIRKYNPACELEVDGGISPKTAPLVVEAGANVLVAGSAVYGREDIPGAIQALRDST